MSGADDSRFADEDAELVAREREQHMAMLRDIPRRRAELAEHERIVVHYARLLGISWDDIAAAVGGFNSGQQAAERYGEPSPEADPF